MTILYNKTNNTQFEEKHAIYKTYNFIKKLNTALYFYTDGTFIYCSGFKQLIIIL